MLDCSADRYKPVENARLLPAISLPGQNQLRSLPDSPVMFDAYERHNREIVSSGGRIVGDFRQLFTFPMCGGCGRGVAHLSESISKSGSSN